MTTCPGHGIHFVSIDATAGEVVTYSIDSTNVAAVGGISPEDLCFDSACLEHSSSGGGGGPCCDETEPHVHAHLKSDGCRGDASSDGDVDEEGEAPASAKQSSSNAEQRGKKKTIVKLKKEQAMPAAHLAPPHPGGCDPEDASATEGCGHHKHGEGCGHIKIAHGDQ